MKARAAAAVALWALSGAPATADAAWPIGARSVPPPQAASPALRQAVARAPAPDVAARRAERPDSIEAWRALIAERRVRRSRIVDAHLLQRAVDVTPTTRAGVAAFEVRPRTVAARHREHLLLYLHGGSYVNGGGRSGLTEALIIAESAAIPVLAVDYRMPPDHPFPAAVDDVVAVYRDVLERYPPEATAVGGTSAGGGLALAAVHRFKALGLPVPGAVYAGTPWADLTKTGDTMFTNEGLDRALVTYDGPLGGAALLYAAGRDLTDPLLSPVYGDFAGFPPTYLVTGTRDLFLSDTVRVHRKLRVAGVAADLNVFEAMAHAEYLQQPEAPESQQVYAGLGQFLVEHLR